MGDLTAGALKIARVAVDSRVGTKNMTAAALESIDESEFRAQGKIEDNRLTVYLWGNADQRGRSLGVAGYITKPVRADRLLALVAQHLRGGRTPLA